MSTSSPATAGPPPGSTDPSGPELTTARYNQLSPRFTPTPNFGTVALGQQPTGSQPGYPSQQPLGTQSQSPPLYPQHLPTSTARQQSSTIGDSHPPGTTLFVGNLTTALPSPTSPDGSGTINATGEAAAGANGAAQELHDALRGLFGAQPGFWAMAFRILPSPSHDPSPPSLDVCQQLSNATTPTGSTDRYSPPLTTGNGSPVCFVEFDSVANANAARTTLNGHLVQGRIKPPGLRLSFAKNPLFRR